LDTITPPVLGKFPIKVKFSMTISNRHDVHRAPLRIPN
jgi:hypothetical protein